MTRVRWRGRIEIIGVNPYVRVRAAAAARLRPGWHRAMPIRFWLNGAVGEPWRVSLMPSGHGPFYLYLNGTIRSATKTTVGDRVAVEAEFDTDYRGGPIHPMPPPLRAGLRRSEAARSGWNGLPPSRQKEVLRYLAGLQGEATLRRNVDLTLRALEGEEVRFLGRTWNVPGEGARPRSRRVRP